MATGEKGFGHSIGLGGFSDWVAPRRNAMLGLASGLLSAPDFSQGLSTGFARAADGRQQDDAYAKMQAEEAERQKKITDAAALKDKYSKFFIDNGRADIAQGIVDGLVEPGAAYMDFIKPKDAGSQPASVQEYQFYSDQTTAAGQQPLPYDEWRKGSNQTVRAGLGQPIAMRNKKTGEFAPFQPMSDGTMINTLTGEPANEADWSYDPAAVTGAKTTATVDAKTAAAARAALPSAEQMKTVTDQAIAGVRASTAGMKEWFGQIGPRGAYIHPGSEMGKFYAAASPTNAQAFMQARNMLKGGGQITDYEGRRAEDAISRMQAALDTGDQTQYLEAVADFEAAVIDGYNKLQQTAQGGYAAGTPAVGGQGGNKTTSGVSWSVEP